MMVNLNRHIWNLISGLSHTNEIFIWRHLQCCSPIFSKKPLILQFCHIASEISLYFSYLQFISNTQIQKQKGNWRRAGERGRRKVKNKKEKGCLDGSVRWALYFDSGHHLMVLEFQPHLRLYAASSEPGVCFVFYVSVSLHPSPLVLSLSSLQKMYKH